MIRAILAETAKTIDSLWFPHPIRVGIDGPSASGKTTFADQLEESLRERNRSVIRSSIDGFHNPPETRYQKGNLCSIGYVEDSFDKQAVVEGLLNSLGPKGNLAYRESKFDFQSPTLFSNQPIP